MLVNIDPDNLVSWIPGKYTRFEEIQDLQINE
jgi:hypothetical protein